MIPATLNIERAKPKGEKDHPPIYLTVAAGAHLIRICIQPNEWSQALGGSGVTQACEATDAG